MSENNRIGDAYQGFEKQIPSQTPVSIKINKKPSIVYGKKKKGGGDFGKALAAY